jgi:hypothetical protein
MGNSGMACVGIGTANAASVASGFEDMLGLSVGSVWAGVAAVAWGSGVGAAVGCWVGGCGVGDGVAVGLGVCVGVAVWAIVVVGSGVGVAVGS